MPTRAIRELPWSPATGLAVAELGEAFRGGVTLLVGAGISASEFPMASALKSAIGSTLIENAAEVGDTERAEFLSPAPWSGMSLEALLAWMSDSLGEEAVHATTEVFGGGRPAGPHRFVAECLGRGFTRTVFTTNFDELIEAACREAGVPVDRRLYDAKSSDAASREGAPRRLLKLHGTASAVSSILTVVRDIYRARASPLLAALRAEAERRPLVVAGYSGGDLLDIMPALSSATIRTLYWILHAEPDKEAAEVVESTPAPALRYLSLFARQGPVHVLVGDTDRVWEELSVDLGFPEPAAARPSRTAVQLERLASVVRSRPAGAWELIDRFDVLGSTPADRIAHYLQREDPFVNEVFRAGGFGGWRLHYAAAKPEVTRRIAESYRRYAMTLRRHGDVDRSGYYAENAVRKAQEMFDFLGDHGALAAMDADLLDLNLWRGHLQPRDDLEPASDPLAERRAVHMSLIHAWRELRRGFPNAAFELLSDCRDRVVALDDIEMQTLADGMMVAVADAVQTDPLGLCAFDLQLGWDRQRPRFLESAARYARHLSAGVPCSLDRNVTMAAVARLLLHCFGEGAKRHTENDADFFLSGTQGEIGGYLDEAAEAGVTKKGFERTLRACREGSA